MKLFEDPAFTMYAMECEGDLPTHTGLLNKAVKLHKNENRRTIDNFLLIEAGLCPAGLSQDDINYILSRI